MMCKRQSLCILILLTLSHPVCQMSPRTAGKCSTSLMIMKSAALTPGCRTGRTNRLSRVMPTSALMPWTYTSRPTASSGPTGTPAASPPTSCPPCHPHLAPHPTPTAARGKAREPLPTSRYVITTSLFIYSFI